MFRSVIKRSTPSIESAVATPARRASARELAPWLGVLLLSLPSCWREVVSLGDGQDQSGTGGSAMSGAGGHGPQDSCDAGLGGGAGGSGDAQSGDDSGATGSGGTNGPIGVELASLPAAPAP